MDSYGFLSLNKEKKDVPITEGGIKISKSKEEIKRSHTIPGMGDPFEIPEQPFMEEQKAKKKEEKKDDTHKKNKELENIGEEFLGNINEQEIELDFSQDKLNKLDNDLSLISERNSLSVMAEENRLLKLNAVPKAVKKKAIKADIQLRAVGKQIVKRGRFSDDAIRAGLDFMKKVDKWAGRSDDPSQDENAFYGALGSNATIDYLYVDGKPIKDFVAEKYGYTGSDNKVQERDVLSAYAAMITSRQNHAITLVRPTYIDGHADVDIRNLTVDMSSFNRKRGEKAKAIGLALRGEDYRKYCETAYRSDMRAKAVQAALGVENKNIPAIGELTALKENLQNAGKGSHQDYDDFVWAFHKYCDAVISLAQDPEDMEINRVTLDTLDKLNIAATSAATDYLKGKKMNLPRHNAVDKIRSYLSAQSGQFGKYLRELNQDETGEKTVALSKLLAKEDAGFVVVGIEEEIESLSHKKQNDENDLNQYTALDPETGISVRQKRILRLKNTISSDATSAKAREQMMKAFADQGSQDDVKLDYSLTFLRCAASAIWMDENYKNSMKQRYPYAADNTDMMLAIIARTQLTQIYEDEFKKNPALQAAMDMWNEQISSEEAKAMTYQSNFVGNRISKKEFDEKGGSTTKRYVTKGEANEITAATHGFLAAKEVKGRPDIVQLVPSLPEYTTLYREQPTEKRIPLRKTMKTMFKAFTRLATDSNGHVKTEIAKFDDKSVTEWFDELLRLSGDDKRQIREAEVFLQEIVHPEITKMLEEEYRAKKVKGYKNKAYNDALDVCENYLELIRGTKSSMVTAAPDVSFNNFVATVNVLNTVKTEDIMNSAHFADFKINGRTLTAEEVSEALEDFKKEIQTNEAEFVSFRNMDIDDVEMPLITSCNDNAQLNEVIMTYFVNKDEEHFRLQYELKNVVKTDPNAALDTLVANLDNIVNSSYGKESEIAKDKARILELDEKRKTGELTKKDRDDLKYIYSKYTKYDWHRAANLGKVGNSQYTSETMAPLPDELIKSPLTNKVLIGKYTSDKPMTTDDDTGFFENEAMNNFYDHDDAFMHCKDHKQVVKSAVKELIRYMVDKLI